MTDLKDYLPDEIIFKLPTTVKFPEVIFLIAFVWMM